MAKRTLKHGKRGSRKMGGRKAKKGSRKTHRKRGGAGNFPPIKIDWTKPIESSKMAKGLFSKDLVYTFTWDPTNGILTLDSTNSKFVGNAVSSLASLAGKGLTARYYDLLDKTVGNETAESFKSAMATNAGMLGAKALSKVVFNTAGESVTAVSLYFKANPEMPVSLKVTPLEGTFKLIKEKFELANGAGELDPVPDPPGVNGPAPMLGDNISGLGNRL